MYIFDVKSELIRLIKIQVYFTVANQFVDIFGTWHHLYVDILYHKCHKLCNRIDVSITYIVNGLKAYIHKCNDVGTGIVIYHEYI